jgi:hypothetical protein
MPHSLKVTAVFCSLFFFVGAISAQKDIIYKKDSSTIRCKVLKTTQSKYSYAFINDKNIVLKASILKSLTDSVKYNHFDSNLVNHPYFKAETNATTGQDEIVKAWQFPVAIGLNIGNILEFNSASGPDKKSLSATLAFDAGFNFYKETSRLAMTNELHWTIGIQKSGLTSGTHIQRVSDDLSTLHDFSYAMNLRNKWNFNLIVKTTTSVFTIFDGDFFKDFNGNGKSQGFLSPYQVILSPGIKFQPNNYFRLSMSPYSISLYGLVSQQIANTGYYTQTYDINNNYDLFVFKQLGAEVNIWYDRKIKKRIEMQYRLGISSDYFSHIANNGLMDGLFITKLKLVKDVYLTHRAILKADLTGKPFKPYYNQTILLSFAKTF